jgi:WD40 repeat protein
MHNYRFIAFFVLVAVMAMASEPGISQEWRFYKFLDGHDKSVSTLDCYWEKTGDRSKSYLVSGSQDGSAIVWDVESATVRHRLFASGKQIWSLAASPDGKTVAVGTGDSKIVLFNPWTGQKQATYTGHTGRIWDLAWGPASRWLASCDDMGTVMLWSIEKGTAAHVLKSDPDDKVLGTVAFSPDGKIVAFSSRGDKIYICDAETGARLNVITGLNEEPKTMSFSPDGRMLVSAGGDNMITIRSTSNWEIIEELGGHTLKVKAVRWSKDSQRLFSGGDDRQVIEWDVKTKSIRHKLTISKQYVNDIALCRTDREWLLAAARPAGIELFEPSLYRRLGGRDNIATLVDNFIEKMLNNDILNANPAIEDARDSLLTPELRNEVTTWLCQATGGPHKYTGRSIKEVFQPLKITEEEWQAMVADLKEILNISRIPGKEQEELRAIVENIKPDVVISGK